MKLNPKCDYLVHDEFSETNIEHIIIELKRLKSLLAGAVARPLRERYRDYNHLSDYEKISFEVTIFEIDSRSSIVASMVRNNERNIPVSLSIEHLDVTAASYTPFRDPSLSRGISFNDETWHGQQSDVPVISKERVGYAIDRWTSLFRNTLAGPTGCNDVLAHMVAARQFVGSVASLAEDRGILPYVAQRSDDWGDDWKFTVNASFPSPAQLPQVYFEGEGDDDFNDHYDYLSKEAAAIYSLALPWIIEAYKTTDSPSLDRSDAGPTRSFGVGFRQYHARFLEFIPNNDLQHELSNLPAFPPGTIRLHHVPDPEPS